MSFLAALRVNAPEVTEEEAPQVGGATVTKAVIDTNAIVKGFHLERFAEEAVTIPEVLAEVKDKQARHTLASLPFELKIKDPDEKKEFDGHPRGGPYDEDAIKAVRRFARLTGDLGALSEPDVKVIALAYMLERDAHGVEHLRSEPPPLVLSKHKHNKATKQPGWDFVPNADDWAELDAMNEEAEQAAAAMASKLADATLEAEAAEEAEAAAAAAKVIAAAAAKVVVLPGGAGAGREQNPSSSSEGQNAAAGGEQQQQDDDGGGGGGGDDDDDDGGGWEQNVSRTTRIRRMKREERRKAREEEEKLNAEKAAAAAADDAERKKTLDQSADDAAAFFKAAPEAVPEGAEDEDEEDEDTNAAGGSADAGGASGSGSRSGGGGGEEAEEEEENDEEGDWSDEGEGEEEEEEDAFESSVSCITADYAMQNVILQMNLRLLTPDGMRITNLRRWVLRCHACGGAVSSTHSFYLHPLNLI